MSADKETLAVYAKRAGDYAKRFGSSSVGRHVASFLAELPAGARIVDLGCGPGHAAAAMQRDGFEVDAIDASPELAEIARTQNQVNVRVGTFEALDAVNYYDGVFANFSLLHAPKSEMPDHLTRISRALVRDGVLHLGLKRGSGEKRDTIGRFYAYYELEELTDLLTKAGFQVIGVTEGQEAGLDGTVAPWIVLLARKND
ncbi:MAG: class I SAM-dependent methyltransferase [Pseudomonadota bacterium]